jgi:hypothetical protein
MKDKKPKPAKILDARGVADDADEVAAVRHDVEVGPASITPRGSAGNACRRVGGERPFDHDGGRGMHEGHVS